MDANELKKTLEQIAALLKTLPEARHAGRSVSLGVDDAATDLLISIGGTRDVSVYGDEKPTAIEGTNLYVDGVLFRAQKTSRPATDDEIAGLASARTHTTTAYTRSAA